MTRLALVTCLDQPGLTSDDELLSQALQAEGVEVCALAWNNAQVDWSPFDGILIRSAWDYHQHLSAFTDWIAGIEASGVPLWNAPDTLRWNVNKTYLRHLAEAGVATVPTHWIGQGAENVDVHGIMQSRGWTDVVLKPAVSAGGRGVTRYKEGDPVPSVVELTAATAQSELMLQPFLPEIDRGELSFILLHGELSHVVRKMPKQGDFRVQAKFGGSVERVDPAPSMVEQAMQAAAVAGNPLYARVDGLDIDGQLLVMELELIEPDLFFHAAPESAARMAAVLARTIRP